MLFFPVSIKILENSVREFSFPGIKKFWKILSWKKTVLEFYRNNFTKKIFFPGIYSSGIFHSWNSVLELSVPGILFHRIFLLPNCMHNRKAWRTYMRKSMDKTWFLFCSILRLTGEIRNIPPLWHFFVTIRLNPFEWFLSSWFCAVWVQFTR